MKQNLQKKVQQITQQIESLQLLRSQLQGLLSGWKDQPSKDIAAQTICPNLEAEQFNFVREREAITV